MSDIVKTSTRVTAPVYIKQIGLDQGKEGEREVAVVKIDCELFTSSCILVLPIRLGEQISLQDRLQVTLELVHPDDDGY